MWNLKYDTNELIYKTETDLQTQKTDLWLPKGKGGGGGINQELGINRYTLLYIKQINNNFLFIAQGTIVYLVVTYNGKESEKQYIFIYN